MNVLKCSEIVTGFLLHLLLAFFDLLTSLGSLLRSTNALTLYLLKVLILFFLFFVFVFLANLLLRHQLRDELISPALGFFRSQDFLAISGWLFSTG